MREILFRGKRLDNGEWVEGYITEHTLIPCVMQSYIGWVIECKSTKLYECDWFEVDPNTVGQYTGLKDRNGKPIFEGDVFDWGYAGVKDTRYAIVYDERLASFVGERGGGIVRLNGIDLEIIGNIHDNPELMGGGE